MLFQFLALVDFDADKSWAGQIHSQSQDQSYPSTFWSRFWAELKSVSSNEIKSDAMEEAGNEIENRKSFSSTHWDFSDWSTAGVYSGQTCIRLHGESLAEEGWGWGMVSGSGASWINYEEKIYFENFLSKDVDWTDINVCIAEYFLIDCAVLGSEWEIIPWIKLHLLQINLRTPFDVKPKLFPASSFF